MSAMQSALKSGTRRSFLGGLAWTAAAFSVRGAFAEELVRTPRQTEGPFYPDHLPLDTDNDLLIINDAITPGVGQITHLTGRILDAQGEPLRGALVEIWQCDNNGAYLHSGSGNADRRDDTDRARRLGLRPPGAGCGTAHPRRAASRCPAPGRDR